MSKDDKDQKFNVNLSPEKLQILYTDTIFINVNDDGVTMDICQKAGNSNQIQVVARVGMSRTHANKFAKKLNEILALTSKHVSKEKKN